MSFGRIRRYTITCSGLTCLPVIILSALSAEPGCLLPKLSLGLLVHNTLVIFPRLCCTKGITSLFKDNSQVPEVQLVGFDTIVYAFRELNQYWVCILEPRWKVVAWTTKPFWCQTFEMAYYFPKMPLRVQHPNTPWVTSRKGLYNTIEKHIMLSVSIQCSLVHSPEIYKSLRVIAWQGQWRSRWH